MKYKKILKMVKKIIFDQQGILAGEKYKKRQWVKIISHNDLEIKGFFGDYRWLSNFCTAKIFLDNQEYSSIETAYQAAKFSVEKRSYFHTCTAKESIIYAEEYKNDYAYPLEIWNERKLKIMESLLVQKFDADLNPDLTKNLLNTKDKYLEETNYWKDTFWGVYRVNNTETGKGENNLGKLIMKIRNNL